MIPAKSVTLDRETYTKKDLATLFELSANTIYKTLQCCGLPTAAQCYSMDNIKQSFVAARAMLETGQTYQNVAIHFQPQATQTQQETEFHASGFCANTNEEAADGQHMALFGVADGMARQHATAIRQLYYPLLAHHLGQQLQDSGQQLQMLAASMTAVAPETLLGQGMQRMALEGDRSFGNIPALNPANFDPSLV